MISKHGTEHFIYVLDENKAGKFLLLVTNLTPQDHKDQLSDKGKTIVICTEQKNNLIGLGLSTTIF